MPDQGLIDGLIETYRSLNFNVRRIEESKLRGKTGGSSVRDLMYRLRDGELRFSQALKERVTGVPMPDLFGEHELPALGTETEDDTTATLIAQFGTARESTLSMLRDLSDAEWDVSSSGEKTIRTRVFELLDNDRRQLDRIQTALGVS